MPAPTALPTWATDENYTNGADVGLPTRLEPTSAEKAEGLFRGKRAPARKLNLILGLLCDWVTHLSTERPTVLRLAPGFTTIDPADYPWAKWFIVDLVAGGASGAGGHPDVGSNSGGGGGSGGRKAVRIPAEFLAGSVLRISVGSGGEAPGEDEDGNDGEASTVTRGTGPSGRSLLRVAPGKAGLKNGTGGAGYCGGGEGVSEGGNDGGNGGARGSGGYGGGGGSS